jgi:hypothetical protein
MKQKVLSRALALLLATVGSCLSGQSMAADLTESQLRADYNRWAINQDNQEYRTRHILVRTSEEASAALEEIKNGASFADVASRISRDPGSKAKGGDLGWVRPADTIREFATGMRNAGIGLYPHPVHTAFGWHVIQVDEVRPWRVPPFEEWRARTAARPASAGAADPSAAATAASAAMPAWSQEQWEALFATAEHTAGGSSYVYREATTTDAEMAQRWSRFGMITVRGLRDIRARNLIDVPPALRFALLHLYQPDDVSPPVLRTLADGRKEWSVLKLVRRGTASPLKFDSPFRADAATWVASGKLPAPDQLNDPMAQARIAYWRVFNPEQIARVPSSLSADIEYGDHGTPLLTALLRKNLEAAEALVRRGADLNHCGAWGCPITFAARMPDAAESLAWVGWMLKNGAKPDATDPRGPEILSTALAAAVWHGHREVALRLLDAGASVDGVRDAITTPIEAAAMKGNKPMAEWLLSRGASVMPRPALTGLGVSSVYTAAQSANDAALSAWAETTMLQAAMARPEFRFEMYFEQAGRHINPDRDGRVQLKPAPFKMVFRLPDGTDGVQVGSSLHASWLDEIRAGDLRNAMYRPLASVALSDAAKPGSDYLVLSPPCPSAAPADPGCDGAPMFLSVDPDARDDFHERRTKGGKAYVRAVSHVVDTAEGDGHATDVPLGHLDGKTLYIATAVPLSIGGATGTRLIRPQLLSVKFAR